MPRSVRSDFAKMRCGVAPLQIEIGRYTGQAESDRLCPMCMKDIESENHVLIDCDFYFDITESLMTNASNIDPCFITCAPLIDFVFSCPMNSYKLTLPKPAKKCYLVDRVLYMCNVFLVICNIV